MPPLHPNRVASVLLFAGFTVAGALSAEDAAPPATTPPYDSQGHRDPFIPLVRDGKIVGNVEGMQVTGTVPSLLGILWDPSGNSLALLNDAEVRVGEVINGYRVEAIRPDAVVLSAGGEPVVLTITYETPPKISPEATTGGQKP